MRIAVVQTNPTTGDFQKNITTALELARKAQESGAQLVVFPLGTLVGANMGGLLDSASFRQRVRNCVDAFAQNAIVPALVGGVVEPDGVAPARMVPFLCRGGVAQPLVCAPGSVPAFEFGGRVFTVFSEGLSPFDPGSPMPNCVIDLCSVPYRGVASLATSAENLEAARAVVGPAGAWLLHADILGGFDDLVFVGASYVMAPTGTLVDSAAPFANTVMLADLFDPVVQTAVSPENATEDLESDEPQENAGVSIEETALEAAVGGSDKPDSVTAQSARTALDYEALVLALHDYLAKNGISDVVLGLSGGIDSALTAAIAVDAIGASHVHGLLMPSKVSSAGSVDDAKALASALGVETSTVPIKAPLKAFNHALEDVCEGELASLALENTQARIRTVYLMAVSNTFGWLLLNTGNKSEAAMGFSTLYGDTAGAFAPLGDIYKTHVYELAEWRNRQGLVIPRTIMTKAPSAELYEGQLDSDRLPNYDVLDPILQAHVEGGLGLQELIASGFNEALCDDVLRTVSSFEFKRRQEPLAPCISPRSFDARAWPITCSFHDR